MSFWNSADTVDVISQYLNWAGAIAVLAGLAFGARAATLRGRIEAVRAREFESVKAHAAPNTLAFKASQVENDERGLAILVQFTPSKNVPLGALRFVARVPEDSDARIVDFWPWLKGPSFQSGDESKKIDQSGKTAVLRYNLLSIGEPTLRIVVSGPTPITLEGDHGVEAVHLQVGEAFDLFAK